MRLTKHWLPMSAAESAAGSLRAALRLHTAIAHAALERTPLMEELARGQPSPGLYRDYLQRQLRVHLALEAPVRDCMPAAWSRLHLHKSDWLRSDLLAINADVDARPLPALAVPSQAAALGVLYVLEGSTLGLQLVRRQLAPSHPAACEAGRFIRGHGEHTGRHWKAFIAMLDDVPLQHWDEALAAAGATFSTFQDVFSEPADARTERDTETC